MMNQKAIKVSHQLSNKGVSISADENRLVCSRRKLIAGLDRVTNRLETRYFLLSDLELCHLESQMERLQQRLGEVNDRLHDLQVAKAKKWVASFKVTFPDVERDGERRTRLV